MSLLDTCGILTAVPPLAHRVTHAHGTGKPQIQTKIGLGSGLAWRSACVRCAPAGRRSRRRPENTYFQWAVSHEANREDRAVIPRFRWLMVRHRTREWQTHSVQAGPGHPAGSECANSRPYSKGVSRDSTDDYTSGQRAGNGKERHSPVPCKCSRGRTHRITSTHQHDKMAGSGNRFRCVPRRATGNDAGTRALLGDRIRLAQDRGPT